MRDESGDVITESSFYVGAEVTFHGHRFRITDADDKTLRLMEERAAAPGGFAYSNPIAAAENLARRVDGRAEQVRTFLRERDLKVGARMLRYEESRGGGGGVKPRNWNGVLFA